MKKDWPLLLVIFSIALFFRLYKAGGTYYGRDDVILQAFVLDSLPADGILESLTTLDHAALGNPLRVLAYPLGAVVPCFMLGVILLYNAASVPLTEFTWVLPLAVWGAATVFPAYLLGARLRDRAAGLAGAALLALAPLHALVSRSLCAGWVPAFFMESVCILLLINVVREQKRARLHLSAAICIYLFCHNQFPSFLPVLLVAAVALDDTSRPLGAKIKESMKIWLSPSVFAAPLAVLTFLSGMHLFFTYLRPPELRSPAAGIGALGHMVHRGADPGFYLEEVGTSAFYGLGVGLALLLPCALVLWLSGAGRDRRSLVLLVWSAAYLMPFVFFVSPYRSIIKGYLGDGLYPLLLLSGVVFSHYFSQGTRTSVLASAALALVLGGSGVTTVATIHRLDAPSWVTLPRFHGCVLPDTGIKAAGGWLRTNSAAKASLFTVFIDPKTARYYSKRAVYGVLSGEVEDAAACFDALKGRIDYVLLPVDRQDRFGRGRLAGFNERVLIAARDTRLLTIWERGYQGLAETVPLREANDRFDALYATVPSLSGMPDYVPCRDGGLAMAPSAPREGKAR